MIKKHEQIVLCDMSLRSDNNPPSRHILPNDETHHRLIFSSFIHSTTRISTRRFFARPALLPLSATGTVSPLPTICTRPAGTPPEVSNAATSAARFPTVPGWMGIQPNEWAGCQCDPLQ